jgi:hypothetical protein
MHAAVKLAHSAGQIHIAGNRLVFRAVPHKDHVFIRAALGGQMPHQRPRRRAHIVRCGQQGRANPAKQVLVLGGFFNCGAHITMLLTGYGLQGLHRYGLEPLKPKTANCLEHGITLLAGLRHALAQEQRSIGPAYRNTGITLAHKGVKSLEGVLPMRAACAKGDQKNSVSHGGFLYVTCALEARTALAAGNAQAASYEIDVDLPVLY